jgi:hypothetical protein
MDHGNSVAQLGFDFIKPARESEFAHARAFRRDAITN